MINLEQEKKDKEKKRNARELTPNAFRSGIFPIKATQGKN